MKFILIIIFIINWEWGTIFAHMCHDPFRPKRHLVLVPQEEIIELEDKTNFRIYVENTFFTTLEDVELIVENPAFDIDVSPPIIKKLVPSERTFFLVSLRLREGYTEGDYPLKISIKAKSAELHPSIKEIPAVVTKPKQKYPPELKLKEVKPQEKIIKEEEIDLHKELKTQIQPQEKPVEEKTTLKEKVIKEEIIDEKKAEKLPQEEIKESYEEVSEDEEEVGEIIARVGKKPWWESYYLYATLALFIIGLFIWRRLKK